MNKKISTLLLALAACCTTAFADEMYLGYADGNEVTSNVTSLGAVQASAAIKLDHDSFWMYGGCDITGIRVGINSKTSVSNVTLGIYSDLNGEALCTRSVKTLYGDWNDINLTSPVLFPETGDLYITVTVSNAQQIGVSGESFSGCNWLKQSDGAWTAANDLGGSICLEAILDDANFKQHDAQLVRLDNSIGAKGNGYTVSGRIRNNTKEVAEKLTVSYKVQNGTTYIATATANDILPGEMGSFSFDAEPYDVVGTFPISVTVTAVNGTDDTYAANSTCEGELKVYGKLAPRRPLLEMFTTAKCVNCPGGHQRWERVLAHHKTVIVCAHHVGYYTDDWTVSESEDMLTFYNAGGSTYAPAGMIDRTNLSDYGAVDGYGSATPGPALYPNDDDVLGDLFTHEESQYAPLCIDLDYTYNDATRELTINTTVEPLEGFTQPAQPRLNIFLTEDHLWGYQSGSASTYEHNDVIRSFVTPTWGEEIELTPGVSVSKSRTVTLGKDKAGTDWVASNMHIIAFVTNYDALNVNNREVANATEKDITVSEAIHSITADVVDAPARDLLGRPVEAGSRGFRINSGHVSLIR